MITNIFSKSIFFLAAVMLVIAGTACTSSFEDIEGTNISENSIPLANHPETNNINISNDLGPDEVEGETLESVQLESSQSSNPDSQLTQAEIEGLLFMREEEKLARDVYIYLYEVWGKQVFSNIAQSEETHTQAILRLINRYGLDDPSSATEQGEFTNADLQSLYDQLVVAGSLSLKDALLVGAAIEEIDILDIQTFLDETEHEDIAIVYENLIKGSYNHLQAFVRNIGNQAGETYLPQYLSQVAFDEIIGTSIENSRQRGKWGKGGN
jgi:hypothetical protein